MGLSELRRETERRSNDEHQLGKNGILAVCCYVGNRGSGLQKGVIFSWDGRQIWFDARRDGLTGENEAGCCGNAWTGTHRKNRGGTFRELLGLEDGKPDVYAEARQQDLHCLRQKILSNHEDGNVQRA